MANWSYEAIKRQLELFSPSSDPSDAKQRKRLKILQAATELFIQQGYRKTNVQEVAQQAGVAKGTVYLYFKTKADLLIHAIVEEKKRYIEWMEPLLGERLPAPERLRLWLRTLFVLCTEMPLTSRLISGDLEIFNVLEEMSPELKEQSLEFKMEFITELIDRAAAPHRWTPEEIRDRAQVLLGLLYFAGSIANEEVRGGLSVQRFSSILADLLVDGVGRSGPTGRPHRSQGDS